MATSKRTPKTNSHYANSDSIWIAAIQHGISAWRQAQDLGAHVDDPHTLVEQAAKRYLDRAIGVEVGVAQAKERRDRYARRRQTARWKDPIDEAENAQTIQKQLAAVLRGVRKQYPYSAADREGAVQYAYSIYCRALDAGVTVEKPLHWLTQVAKNKLAADYRRWEAEQALHNDPLALRSCLPEGETDYCDEMPRQRELKAIPEVVVDVCDQPETREAYQRRARS